MKLHGNAALSLNKRRQLARRVVEQGRPRCARRGVVLSRSRRRASCWWCGRTPSGWRATGRSGWRRRATGGLRSWSLTATTSGCCVTSRPGLRRGRRRWRSASGWRWRVMCRLAATSLSAGRWSWWVRRGSRTGRCSRGRAALGGWPAVGVAPGLGRGMDLGAGAEAVPHPGASGLRPTARPGASSGPRFRGGPTPAAVAPRASGPRHGSVARAPRRTA
jgi:hypothetical protein